MAIEDNLSFRLVESSLSKDWEGYQPKSFPPSDGFVLSVDSSGNNLSSFGDDSWDFRCFDGSLMHFGQYSEQNKILFKKLMFLHIYHYSLFPGTYKSILNVYSVFQKILEVCDRKDGFVRLDELYRYPIVIEKVAKNIPPSRYNSSITYFNRLLSIEDEIGFKVLDQSGVKLYASLNKNYELGQVAVIPPRIWNHLVNKCDQVLEDFIAHEKKLKKAFNWIAKAYESNRKLNLTSKQYLSPFNNFQSAPLERSLYKGDFHTFIDDYGIRELFEKYVEPKKDAWNKGVERYEVSHLSALFSFGRDAALAYIEAYSLMRRTEARNTRANSLKVDEDEKFGKLYMVESITSKTEDDSEALFPVSSSAEKAFQVGGFIAKLRMRFAPEGTPKDVINNPYISSAVTEPWGTKGRGAASFTTRNSMFDPNRKQLFFSDEEFKIAEDDYQFSIALTPTLLLERKKHEWFKVGNYWKFSDHQLRRTLAVQMNDFGVSGGTIQYCMKHRTRQMQNHYTKNSSRILTNKFARQTFLNERIQQVYLKLADVIQNESGRYVKPYSKLQSVPIEIVNLIEESNFKKLAKEIKAGKTGVRLTILGVCVKKDICEYGGIESISPCMGEHDGSGRVCGDAALDKQKKHDIQKYINYCKEQQKLHENGSPSFEALEKEIKAGNEAIKRMEVA